VRIAETTSFPARAKIVPSYSAHET
jgi:hypothetical protein